MDLSGKRIVVTGAPRFDAVFARPQHAYTRLLLGSALTTDPPRRRAELLADPVAASALSEERAVLVQAVEVVERDAAMAMRDLGGGHRVLAAVGE